MNHDEIEALLGAYALDAVEPDEADQIELHLRGCPRCRAEVRGHREAAALLASSGADAPEGVWAGIQAALSGAGAPVDMPRLLPAARRRPASTGRAAGAAAVAVAALVLAAVVTVRMQHRVDRLQRQVASGRSGDAVAAALLDPGRVEARLASADGRLAAVVVIRPDGSAYVVATDLPALARDRTYQVWGQATSGVVSLGLLGPAPQAAPFRVDRGTSALMVTAEPAGGVPAPDSPVLVQGTVSRG